MRLPFLVIIGVLVLGFFYGREKFRDVPPSTIPGHEQVITGTFLMEDASPGAPRLSLRFLNNNRVQMMGDGSPWGKNDGMCTYVMKGNMMELTHACGVWHLELRDDGLYQKENGFRFRHIR